MLHRLALIPLLLLPLLGLLACAGPAQAGQVPPAAPVPKLFCFDVDQEPARQADPRLNDCEAICATQAAACVFVLAGNTSPHLHCRSEIKQYSLINACRCCTITP